jgi:hypothetical protein
MSTGKDIEIAMAMGGRFDRDETDAILTAAEQARDTGEVAYLTLDGHRIATIGPLPAADRSASPDSGPAGRYVSRQCYANGTRQEVQAVRLTAANYQRVIGRLNGHTEHASWSALSRLNFGGRRGSYSIPVGWWVVLFTPETTPHRAGVEGWDPDDFNAYWISKSDQDREDRHGASLYRSAHRR